jgi:hypothetical protein
MKSLIVLVAVAITGCAVQPYQPILQVQSPALSFEELDHISRNVNNSNCKNIDANIAFVERQLQLKGLTNRLPENLNNADRLYNSTAKSMIWALRIGCNNPRRYDKL